LRHAGIIGLVLFYAIAYGLLFYAHYLLEVRGPAAVLPAALR
jgi:hypothetical protein